VLKDCSVKITQKPDTAASGPGLAVSCNPTLPHQGLVWRGIFVVPHDLAGVDSDENPSNFHQQN
jgi:hypothetical protein